LLSAQTVNIFGKKTIKGIVTSTPPHLSDDDKKLPKIEDFFIDTGYSKTALEKIVSLGDRVSVESFPAELLNGCFSSKAIDDRSGVAAILLTLEKLKGKDIPMKVTALFSAQEETGERGAKTAAFTISPDMAIAVDVSFALTNDDSEFKCGKLGKGPMIGIAPSLDRKMSDDLINTAKENGISYQVEIMNGTTGTNADVIGVTKGGVKAVTVSIPLKYMHTPVEVVDFEDIEKTAELMANFILGGGK
ncbi:MAG: M20/M25/M40 family metallo-hydrolase, partial [Oscillospiraceae bacterium]